MENRVSIIILKGSLEDVYLGLIMANGTLMEGIDVILFFTFFGLDAIIKQRMNNLKVATVGDPALHIPSIIGMLSGMSAFAAAKMKKNGKIRYTASWRIFENDTRCRW